MKEGNETKKIRFFEFSHQISDRKATVESPVMTSESDVHVCVYSPSLHYYSVSIQAALLCQLHRVKMQEMRGRVNSVEKKGSF